MEQHPSSLNVDQHVETEARLQVGGVSSQVNDQFYSKSGFEDDDEGAKRCVALTMPHEVIMRIFSQLDYRDLIHCALACKHWYTESEILREGWKEEYLEACFVPGLIYLNSAVTIPRYEALLACCPD